MAKVIAITNNKGGVGKTTTAISLAGLFADWGLRVALVDNDPQGNIGVYLGQNINDSKRTLSDVYTGFSLKKIGYNPSFHQVLSQHDIQFKQDNLTVFLSNHRLAYVAEDFQKIAALSEFLSEIKPDFDLIIIDNGPYIGFLTRSALLSADMVLIPTEAGVGSLAGITQIIKEAETINDRHWRKITIRAFVNNFLVNEQFDISNLKKLKALLGSRLYNTYVPANQHIRKSKEMGLPIHLVEKISKVSSRGAIAYRILAKNILKDLMPELFNASLPNRLSKIADEYLPGRATAKKPNPDRPQNNGDAGPFPTVQRPNPTPNPLGNHYPAQPLTISPYLNGKVPHIKIDELPPRKPEDN